MALVDTGKRSEDLSAIYARAMNSDGDPVIVKASHEAIHDFGWDEIFAVASQKYTEGKIESGQSLLVQVTTEDFNPKRGQG